MEDKQSRIVEKVVELFSELEKNGIFFKEEEQKAFAAKYIQMEGPLEEIIDAMYKDASQLAKSHDQRNRAQVPQTLEEQQPVKEEEGPKLTFRPPSGNGFANSVMIAVFIGGMLGVLIAFALLSLK